MFRFLLAYLARLCLNSGRMSSTTESTTFQNSGFWTVLALCLIARMLWFLAAGPFQMPTRAQLDFSNDSQGYHDLAITLLDHGEFSRGADRPPDALRTPGYPLFVAAIYSVGDRNPWVVMLFQYLLDTASCALLMLILAQRCGMRVAFWAGLIYAFDPHMILYGGMLLSDSLFVFVLVTFLWIVNSLIAPAESKFAISGWLSSGIVIGIAALIRPAAQFLPVLVLGWMFFAYRRKISTALTYGFMLALGFSVAIAPWVLRNHRVFGHPGLSSSGPYNLLILNVAPAVAEIRELPFAETATRLLLEADSLAAAEGEDLRRMNEFDKAEYWSQTARDYFGKYPLPIALSYMKGVLFTFANLGTADIARVLGRPSTALTDAHGVDEKLSGFISRKSALEICAGILAALMLLVTYAAIARGIWGVRNLGGNAFPWLCAICIIYFAFIAGGGGVARFRLPMVPFYAVFAGMGLAGFHESLRSGSVMK